MTCTLKKLTCACTHPRDFEIYVTVTYLNSYLVLGTGLCYARTFLDSVDLNCMLLTVDRGEEERHIQDQQYQVYSCWTVICQVSFLSPPIHPVSEKWALVFDHPKTEHSHSTLYSLVVWFAKSVKWARVYVDLIFLKKILFGSKKNFLFQL